MLLASLSVLRCAKHSILSIIRLHSKFAFGFLQLGTAVNQLPKTITVPRRNFGEGGSDSSDLSDLSDSRQELFILQHCYSEWINGMKEAAEMSENNAVC